MVVRSVRIACVAFAVVAFALPGPASAKRFPAAPPTVIATIESGVNVLHEDFRLAPGQRPALPAGLPPVTAVELPSAGHFAEQRQAARAAGLGRLQPDVLYHVVGTRLLLYVPTDQPPADVFADPVHGTGVASAAIGLGHGTNPDAWLVVVLDDQPDAPAWEWLADATWIDVVSTSYNNLYAQPVPVVSCPEGALISDITEQGRVVFTAAGNGEQLGEIMSPSGYPDAYQVGGVDDEGRAWIPGRSGTMRPPNHPYETGDRYDFVAADSDSLNGEAGFGGTSGATPSTAGRATELIQLARALLKSRFVGVVDGAVARAPRAGAAPAKGPLSDGDFTGEELVDLLHRTATPAEPETEARYLVEGYGALDDRSTELAKKVLMGTADLPDRPTEDAWHDRIEELRTLLFPESRCA